MQSFKQVDDKKAPKLENLNYGQLALIIEGPQEGGVITKTYDSYVLVYSPNEHSEAFMTTWDGCPGFPIRLLRDDEKIVLDNKTIETVKVLELDTMTARLRKQEEENDEYGGV